MSTMYERIDELCKEHSMTVTDMCRELGISRSSLSELSRGRSKSISAESTAKIAKFFNVTSDYLVGITESSCASQMSYSKNSDFYSEVKQLCEEQGITLTSLANQIGISKGNFNNWRNGSVPKLLIRVKIAQALNKPFDYFFSRGEKRAANLDSADKDSTDLDAKVKEKLKELGKSKKWLIEQIRAETGMYLDYSVLHEVLTGKRKSEVLTTAINRILLKGKDFEMRIIIEGSKDELSDFLEQTIGRPKPAPIANEWMLKEPNKEIFELIEGAPADIIRETTEFIKFLKQKSEVN